MPENDHNNWAILIPIVVVFVIMLPLQIYSIIHLLGRMKKGQEFWIAIIFMFGLLGVAMYFIMPISRQSRIRKDILECFFGEDKGGRRQ